MLIASKLKLAQYKLHNPVFQDNLILSDNLEKKQVTHFSNNCNFLILVATRVFADLDLSGYIGAITLLGIIMTGIKWWV